MKPFGNARISRTDAHGVELALAGGATFSVELLEPSMARLRLKPAAGWREPRTWAIAPQPGLDVAWTGRDRDDRSGFSMPEALVETNDSVATLRSGALVVSLRLNPLQVLWQDTQGRVLLSDRETSAYFASRRTGAMRHYLQREAGERYYGLGDKTGPLDLHGRRLRTLALDSLGYDPQRGDPLYKHWPFVLSRGANGLWHGLYYDTLAACTFDLGCEHDNYHGLYRYVEIDDGDLDCYLMFGATPGEVIARFLRLIGGTHLPPRWSLGFAQTAMGLADAPDAQQQLDRFIDRAGDEGVPVSAFHFGSGYSSRGKRRYVFTWNSSKFPDPRTLNDKFQSSGMHLVANIKPCLLDDHPAYEEVRAQGGFIRDADSGQPVQEQFWDGVGAHLDFSNPVDIAWWQDGLRQQVLDYGFDAGWNDNNEYGVMDDAAQCHGFGQALAMHRARPLHGLLMTRATFEAQRGRLGEQGKQESVFTVTRAGGPGLQRYAQTWSGDNTTSWETLRWNIRTGLQMSLSGMFNVGHDVGGFAGPVPDPELFLRWVQACCLNPRMVMNSWKADGTVNLPWMHESVKAEVLAAIRLRYKLMPYLWSLFERASQHHEPIIRPTFYDFSDDERCYQDCDDFMLGQALLVAPVVQAGATSRNVYLPNGPLAWFDFHTGARLVAGREHLIDAQHDRLPLFARSGAAIPVADGIQGRHRYDDPVTQLRQFG
jgi:alpha-glucosidase